MNIWLKVTHDKYEFPVLMADSAAELADLLKVSVNSIYSGLSHWQKGRCWSPYRKVKVEDDNES